MRVFWYLRV